jgi:hypothetical protein
MAFLLVLIPLSLNAGLSALQASRLDDDSDSVLCSITLITPLMGE